LQAIEQAESKHKHKHELDGVLDQIDIFLNNWRINIGNTWVDGTTAIGMDH